MSERSRQPKIVAFAGKGNVEDADGLRAALREGLSEIRDDLGGRVIAISSASPGADLIFLRICVDLRIPMIVVVPFPEERFSEDFRDQAEWEMVEKISGVALAKYVMPEGNQPPEAYQAVSRNLLEWADVFLFACDGEPPQDTDEIIAEARDTGIPTRIIDTVSLKAEWVVPPDFARNARHGFETRKDLLDFLDLRFATR